MPLQGKRPAADPRKLRHALVLVRWGSDALAEFVAGLAERETKIIRSKIGKNQLTLAITAAATSVKAGSTARRSQIEQKLAPLLASTAR